MRAGPRQEIPPASSLLGRPLAAPGLWRPEPVSGCGSPPVAHRPKPGGSHDHPPRPHRGANQPQRKQHQCKRGCRDFGAPQQQRQQAGRKQGRGVKEGDSPDVRAGGALSAPGLGHEPLQAFSVVHRSGCAAGARSAATLVVFETVAPPAVISAARDCPGCLGPQRIRGSRCRGSFRSPLHRGARRGDGTGTPIQSAGSGHIDCSQVPRNAPAPPSPRGARDAETIWRRDA